MSGEEEALKFTATEELVLDLSPEQASKQACSKQQD